MTSESISCARDDHHLNNGSVAPLKSARWDMKSRPTRKRPEEEEEKEEDEGEGEKRVIIRVTGS